MLSSVIKAQTRGVRESDKNSEMRGSATKQLAEDLQYLKNPKIIASMPGTIKGPFKERETGGSVTRRGGIRK